MKVVRGFLEMSRLSKLRKMILRRSGEQEKQAKERQGVRERERERETRRGRAIINLLSIAKDIVISRVSKNKRR